MAAAEDGGGVVIAVAPARPGEGSADELIEALMPDVPVASPQSVLMARANAEDRAAFLAGFPMLTAEQVAEGRSSARNRSALASRWRKEGRIFAVTHQGRALHPAFQFDDQGEPRPVVAAVLAAFPGRMGEWERALWWAAANGWLADRRPVDLIADDPDALVGAARRLARDEPW